MALRRARRRLPAPVGTEEPGHLPALDGKAQVVYGDGLAVAPGQVVGLNHGRRYGRQRLSTLSLCPEGAVCPIGEPMAGLAKGEDPARWQTGRDDVTRCAG